MELKDQILEDVRAAYKELLPDVHPDDLKEALDVCYKPGMDASELKKKTYAYLYPVRKGSLW